MFCKHCGKEIKDGVSFCPMCGKPTGVKTEPKEQLKNPKNHFQNKKPNPKLLLAILGVVVCVLVVGGIGKKISSSNHAKNIASNGTSSKDYTEENYTKEMSNAENSNKSDDENLSDYKDKKWKKKKSYKQAYKEEYNSFEARIKEYCEQKSVDYAEMVDDVADGFNAAYESLEKEVPGLSEYIGLDIGTAVSDSFTGTGIVSELTTKALNNETVRKTGFKAVIYAGTAFFDWAMNSTTTDYPFGFSLYELRGDYALLRSNGTYKDMEKIINKNMSYDTKTEMLTERISELEKESTDLQDDKNAYAECMGRLAANKDLEKEVKEFYNKCMITIACSGRQYCNGTEIKLYWVIGKDGTVENTFWAPAGTHAENWNFDISLCENGSCLLQTEDSLNNDVEKKRFVIDKAGKIIFEGNSFEAREEEEVGESIICVYGPSGNALRETKVKDSTYGTYYTLELVDTSGNATKLLEGREFVYASDVYYTPYGFEGNGTCSDSALVEYTSLENQSESVIIDLSSGKMYSQEEFAKEKQIPEVQEQEKEENIKLAKSGTPKDGWIKFADSKISVFNDNIEKVLVDLSYRLSSNIRYIEIPEQFNTESLLQSIGETREINGWYRQDNTLWVVTRSGYFYTYDLKTKKRTEDVEIGENAPYSFTPYGLLVYNKNEKGKAETEYESYSGKETENSVYQYDASGKCIVEYPAHNSLGDSVYGFIYCNGKDTYNLATQEMFGM